MDLNFVFRLTPCTSTNHRNVCLFRESQLFTINSCIGSYWYSRFQKNWVSNKLNTKIKNILSKFNQITCLRQGNSALRTIELCLNTIITGISIIPDLLCLCQVFRTNSSNTFSNLLQIASNQPVPRVNKGASHETRHSRVSNSRID